MNTRLLATALVTVICASGCTAFVRTEAVPQFAAKAIDPQRLLAYQEQRPDYATLVVTRDAGFMGAGCYIGLVISGTLAARFDPKETATFFVPAGTPVMAVVPDPLGKGLCGAAGWSPVLERYELKNEAKNLFRISLGAYRRPRLLPVAY